MSAAATPEDIANVCKLLERLRTGEMNLIPSIASVGERKQDKSTEMLQRVEGVLSERLRRMQDPIGNGGPAFPRTGTMTTDGYGHWEQDGMSLRDYFAAKAMHQIIAGAVLPEGYDARKDLAMVAQRSYEIADAMLKARDA